MRTIAVCLSGAGYVSKLLMQESASQLGTVFREYGWRDLRPTSMCGRVASEDLERTMEVVRLLRAGNFEIDDVGESAALTGVSACR